MTDVLTPQPQTLLQLLQAAGAQCGMAAPPDGIRTCPVAGHCRLAGGEICIRGVDDSGASNALASPGLALGSGLGLVLIGVVIGWMLRRR
jgi:hypothetical protein